MNEFLKDFQNLSKNHKIILSILLLFSFFYKLFFLKYQVTDLGPDAMEYQYLANLFAQKGISGYILSDDPFTFWRLPLLPLLMYISKTSTLFFIFQLAASYFLAYNFYMIVKRITLTSQVAFICFIFILFLPYINNAACATLTEFLQILLFIYVLRKAICKEYDVFNFIALSAFCLLRAEAQYFILFLVIRELFLKQFRNILFYIIPVIVVLFWSGRNKYIFDSFSLVNPVLSSRALIGSVYGLIYHIEESGNDFYEKYDYYKARDYKQNKAFVSEYKHEVKNILLQKLTRNPLDYIKTRFKQIAYGFMYFGFDLEKLPDEHWKYKHKPSYEEMNKSNTLWSYQNLIQHKDYLRLILRIFYNGGLAFMHIIGFLFIFLNYKKLLPLIFVFLNFSFVLIVEVDMRYLITIQSVCVCAFVIAMYSLIKHKSLLLHWIPK